MQSKKGSFIEAFINTFSGFLISLITINVVLPLFGLDVKPIDSIIITFIFTVISIIRSYLIRRLFNTLFIKGIIK